LNAGTFRVTEYDKEIVSLAQQVLGQPKPKSEPPAAKQTSSQTAGIKAPPQPSETRSEARKERADSPQARETKTAEELARMIEADLAKHPQCPSKGFVVTVYGATYWRAMLMITPAAGPLRNAQQWRDLTDELAERLRQRYDMAWR
jgi:hypothetical protein